MERRYLLPAAWAAALPARAEGGHMYPPEGAIALGIFMFGLGIPLALAGLAGGMLRWWRPAAQRPWGLIFWGAWLTWMAGMGALMAGFSWGLSDEHAILLDGALSFGAALLAAWLPGRGKTPLTASPVPAANNLQP